MVVLLTLSFGCPVTVNVLCFSLRFHGLVYIVCLWCFLIILTFLTKIHVHIIFLLCCSIPWVASRHIRIVATAILSHHLLSNKGVVMLRRLWKIQNFQSVNFAISFVTLNGHTYKLFKNISNDVQIDGNLR